MNRLGNDDRCESGVCFGGSLNCSRDLGSQLLEVALPTSVLIGSWFAELSYRSGAVWVRRIVWEPTVGLCLEAGSNASESGSGLHQSDHQAHSANSRSHQIRVQHALLHVWCCFGERNRLGKDNPSVSVDRWSDFFKIGPDRTSQLGRIALPTADLIGSMLSVFVYPSGVVLVRQVVWGQTIGFCPGSSWAEF